MSLIRYDAIFGPSWCASVSISTLRKVYRPEHILNLNIPDLCHKQRLAIMQGNNGAKQENNTNDDQVDDDGDGEAVNSFPKSSLPLRLHSNLLVGTARIFQQQVDDLMIDCSNLCFIAHTKSKTKKYVSMKGCVTVKKPGRKKKTEKEASFAHDDVEQENLSGEYFSQLMDDFYDKLKIEAEQPIVINTSFNVQIQHITMKETKEPPLFISKQVDLMTEDEENFGSNRDATIDDFNDATDNLSSCAGDYSRDDYECISNIDQPCVQKPIKDCLDIVPSTSIMQKCHATPRVHSKMLMNNCTRKRKARNVPQVIKKVRVNRGAPKPPKTPQLLRSASSIKRSHSFASSLANTPDEVSPSKRILRELNSNDINNNENYGMTEFHEEPVHYMSSRASSVASNVLVNNCEENSISAHHEIFSRPSSVVSNVLSNNSQVDYDGKVEKWKPAGVLKMLYGIWRSRENDDNALQMLDANVFLAAADLRITRALGFSSLLSLAQSGLVRLVPYKDSIKLKFIVKGNLFDFLFKKP